MALGLRDDGRKEIIDYRLAGAESAAQWEQFLTDLFRRGLEGARLEMIGVDGGAGLLAAVAVVYLGVPVQRCWAHKIMNAANRVRARSPARRFADRWQDRYAKAVECLRRDLDELLTCYQYKTLAERKAVRTTVNVYVDPSNDGSAK